MSKKCKKTRKCLNYIEHLLILILTVLGCVSFFSFTSLVCVPIGITTSALGIKICAITASTEKHKSIMNKKKKDHDKVVLLGKDKLNTIKVIIRTSFIDSFISHEQFVSVKNILREYNEITNFVR